jgi:tetratricopeptide (TPR) repeat protein
MIHVLLILTLLPQLVAASPSTDAQKHLQAGLDAQRQGRLEAAITEFHTVTELAPGAVAGYVRLGGAYIQEHEYQQAIAPLKHALDLDADLAPAHQLLGYALLMQGYAAEAIPHLDRVHEYGALGIAQIQADQPSEAVKNLQLALERNPNDPDLLFYLSRASQMLSNSSISTLAAHFPASARVHQVMGQNYFIVKQLPQAEKEYQQALALGPDLPGLHMELGQIYAEGGQWVKAAEQFSIEAKHQPGNGEIAYRLGDALLRQGKPAEAAAELKRSDELRPDMSETLYALGKAAFATGDSETAEHVWSRVVEIEKNSSLAGQAHFSLAGLYRKTGKAEQASKEMQSFRELQGQKLEPAAQ